MEFDPRFEIHTPIFLGINLFFIFIIIYIILKVYHYQQNHKAIATLTIPLILFMLSELTLDVALFIGRFIYVFGYVINEVLAYTFGYMLYFIFWIIGMNNFLRQTIRLPPRNHTQFIRIQFGLYVLAVIAGIAGVLAFVLSRSELYFTLTYDELFQAIFLLMSQIAILVFIFFAVVLTREKKMNTSKLIKARFDMLKYAVFVQILISLNVLEVAFMLYFNTIAEYILEFYSFMFLETLTIISTILLYNSIHIPNFIRAQYILSSRRFSRIRKSR